MGSHIDISQTHSLGKREAKQRAIAAMEEVGAKWGLSVYWIDAVCNIAGMGITGTLTVKGESVQAVMDLPSTFDSQVAVIEDKLRYQLIRRLDPSYGAPPPPVQLPPEVQYGEQVYLKLATSPGRFLTGGRDAANDRVYSKTAVDKDANFRWVLARDRSNPGTGAVQYGDVVYLNVIFSANCWLTGARGDGNQYVYTKDPAGEPTLLAYYKWKIMQSRTSVGSGPVPADGTIYLKCEGMANRWLTGGRSDGNEAVLTRDGENGALEPNYKWIVKRQAN